MSTSHAVLKIARQIHHYVGVFIAPALLFFAFTGGLQVFSLHESRPGSDYKPPAWAALFAQIHKKQTTVMPQRRPPRQAEHAPAPGEGAAQAPDNAPRPDAPPRPVPNGGGSLPLKIFSALVAVGLFVESVLGIYMAYRYTRRPVLITAILLAGVVLPVWFALLTG